MKLKNNLNNGKKEKKKIKYTSVKSSLANPFSLDWPSLNYKQYSEVVASLKEYLTNLCKEVLTGISESDLEVKKNAKVTACKSAASNSLIFGFNAVMRNIEKNNVKCVFVNSEAKPDYLLKSFIPACKVKVIPLVPVQGLSRIVQETFGLKSTLALGLKKSVCDEKGSLHSVYTKCCELVGLKNNVPRTDLKATSKILEIKPIKIISEDEIKAYHLKRTNKSERAFKPPKSNSKMSKNILGLNKDFIGINESKAKFVLPVKPWRKKHRPQKDWWIEEKTTEDCGFFIDSVGIKEKEESKDTDLKKEKIETEDNQNVKLKEEEKEFKKETEKTLKKEVVNEHKRTLDHVDFHYVPAKMKRTKGNPNRKRR